MASYALQAERKTLHGTFSIEHAPVLTIDPGDTVSFSTLISSWTLDPDGTPYPERDPELDKGHALVGPVWVRGATPAEMLEIRVGAVRPGSWGQSAAGGGAWGLNAEMGLTGPPTVRMNWALDVARQRGRNQYGHNVRLAPFMGVMGMPPPEPGIHSTRPPRIWGGNIDCRELGEGSILYLPIPVDGALFSTGDGHAAQGDGEVSGIAIECPMDRVDLTFDLKTHRDIPGPHAVTAAGWITFGFDEDLDAAAMMALDSMLHLMVKRLHLESRKHALALATVVVQMRVTQLVNGVRGVHAILPHDALVE